MRNFVKIADVAKLVGVSQSTVSNYLNGRTNRMSESVRIKIKDAIEQLDYIPNVAARNISSKQQNNTIVILAPQSSSVIFYNTFYSRVLEGIENTLNKHGYRSIIIPIDRDALDEGLAFVRGLSMGMVSGVLLFNIEKMDPILTTLKQYSIPVVAFGYDENYEADLSFIATDHGDGVKQIIKHFVEIHNNRNITFFLGKEEINITTQRLIGYKEGLALYDIPYDPSRVFFTKSDRSNCYEVTQNILGQHGMQQAFIINQSDTNSFIKAIRDCGLTPGKDVLFVLDEYFPINTYERYEYAYLNTPVYELGATGAERLLKIINNEKLGSKNYLFPVELIPNETCGCL